MVVSYITTTNHFDLQEYFFVGVKLSEYENYKKDLKSRSLDLKNYSLKVLRSGYGKPSEKIKKDILEEFNSLT